jgi:hypothetical protein
MHREKPAATSGLEPVIHHRRNNRQGKAVVLQGRNRLFSTGKTTAREKRAALPGRNRLFTTGKTTGREKGAVL